MKNNALHISIEKICERSFFNQRSNVLINRTKCLFQTSSDWDSKNAIIANAAKNCCTAKNAAEKTTESYFSSSRSALFFETIAKGIACILFVANSFLIGLSVFS